MLRTLLAGSSLVLLACGSPTGPGGLRLDLTGPTEAIVPGVVVSFSLTVENRSPAPVTVTGSGSCTFRWELEDVHQVRVCTADLQSWTFAPFETRVFPLTWDGYLFDIEGQRAPAPPGAYQVRGVLDATEGQGRTDPVVIAVVTP